ncbi:hypothetical protein [Streptomyces sp. Da 82-17]|uniref:hypothetical protein n=1 Tax=Streptomyces sp. Da 82-17 TaxID=3377116 RepID=UPI0038D4AD98
MPDPSGPPKVERLLYMGGLALMGGFVVLAFGQLFAAVAAVLVGAGTLVMAAARRGTSALKAGRTRRARLLFAAATAPVSLLGLAVSWLVGALSGALDVSEACIARQQHFDAGYRALHADEMSRWFPLRNACNADYDLVPVWVNPAVVLFALLLVASIAVLAGGLASRIVNGRAQPGS